MSPTPEPCPLSPHPRCRDCGEVLRHISLRLPKPGDPCPSCEGLRNDYAAVVESICGLEPGVPTKALLCGPTCSSLRDAVREYLAAHDRACVWWEVPRRANEAENNYADALAALRLAAGEP